MTALTELQIDALKSACEPLDEYTDRCGLRLYDKYTWMGRKNKKYQASTVRALEKIGLLKVFEFNGVAEITDAGREALEGRAPATDNQPNW